MFGTSSITTEDSIDTYDKNIGKKFKKNGQKKPGGTYCCVKGCHKNEGANSPETRFFRFPKRRNPEQHELWLKAINRVCPDGSPWEPSKTGVVCSEHFISGRPSPTRIDPDYVPSIFGTDQAKNKAKQLGLSAKARANRVIQRRLTTPWTPSSMITHTECTHDNHSVKPLDQSGLRAKVKIKWGFQKHFTELSSPYIDEDVQFEDNKDTLKPEDFLEISNENREISEEKTNPNRFKENGQKKRGGNYCCVEGCHKNEWKNRPETSFFKFPKNRNPEQHELWLKAINRVNPDGSPWIPHPLRGLVCSEHFISGRPSPTRTDPDYVPSIFEAVPARVKAKQSGLKVEPFKNGQKRVLQSCCVEGCHKNEWEHRPESSFFKFPKGKNPEQHELWLKAINRVNPDGSPWKPNPKGGGLVCSEHFISGRPSHTRTDPDYAPSIIEAVPARVKSKESGLKVEPFEDPLKDL